MTATEVTTIGMPPARRRPATPDTIAAELSAARRRCADLERSVRAARDLMQDVAEERDQARALVGQLEVELAIARDLADQYRAAYEREHGLALAAADSYAAEAQQAMELRRERDEARAELQRVLEERPVVLEIEDAR